MAFAALAALGLAACDESGQFALPGTGGQVAADRPLPANARNQRVSEERDVERPDIFEANDRGLWDGRPSLGGVWVAHPDVDDPERVLIRNTDNGETIVGALFRRERELPGPAIQISSDAAEELRILPGAPTQLYVVVLRREEVSVIAPEDNPVVASLEAPVNVEAAPLDTASPPVGGPVGEGALAATAATTAEVADAAADTGAAAATFAAAASLAAADAAQAPIVEETETVDVSAIFDAPTAPADGPRAQLGIYSREENALRDAEQVRAAGIAAEVLTETMGGQTVWRLVAGPLVNAEVVNTLQEMGFVDAFVLDDAE